MEIEKPAILDILDVRTPALSTTTDMPVVETKPDSSPVEEKKEAVPPEEGEAEQLEESATSTTETPGQPTEEKAPRGVGKKIAELTKQRAEAEARAKQAEDNLAAALALRKQAEPVVEDPEPVKPSKETFSDPDAYDTALLAYADEKAAHTARKQVKEMLAENEQKVQQAQTEEIERRTIETYLARVETAKTKYPDFAEVGYSPDVLVSPVVKKALEMSPEGPDIQYYLGKNPQEAKRIIQLPFTDQLIELGKISAKLDSPKPPISNASPPIKPLKTGATVIAKTPDEESMEEYASRRKKELSQQMRH